MESLFDLPAHPLFVHVPVVLTPIVCLVAVVLAARPALRARYGWWFLGGVGVVVVGMLLAISSGEAFDDILDGAVPTKKHRDLAETTRLIMFGWVLAIAALFTVDRIGADRRDGWVQPARLACSALTVVTAVLLTVWVIRTGHEGARITWTGILPE
ncbi:MAG: hypothetical protein KDB21_09460 [Acidimicrobiales bacterium]|nr:hypothetical protein [Acidimicrobiales bacterium]